MAFLFLSFLKKNVNIDLGCCSRRCFHSRRDWSHSNSSSSCSNGSKSSALQFRAHTRAALNMNERRAAVRLRHPKEERERPREGEGGRESVTGVRHLAAQMRYSGCPGALLHGVCRWQHWTLVFLISFCTGWTAVIKGYTFLKIYIFFLRDPHAHFDWLLCSSWPHAEQHCSVFISHCPMWCVCTLVWEIWYVFMSACAVVERSWMHIGSSACWALVRVRACTLASV